MKPAGGNYSSCKNRIKNLNLDITHFGSPKERMGWSRGKRVQRKLPPLKQVLVENCTYKSSTLKKRLIQDGYFEEICSMCKLTKWLQEPIPLELHHINGVSTDNRIENLTLLCPNCHAKTPNYRGKNKKSK